MNPGSNETKSPAVAVKIPFVFCRNPLLLIFSTGLLVVLAIMLTGCRSSRNPFSYDPFSYNPFLFSPSNTMVKLPTINPETTAYPTNELNEGDVVSITFEYSTNFNTIQKIPLDGMLNLDMVGPVKASGKTLTKLQEDMAGLYKPLVKDDVITVKLVTSAACIYVSGAVLRPGAVEMNRPLTVIEAVMGAGGFDNARAKLSDVTVLRIENGQQQTYHVNLKKVLEGREKSPFYLKPFDIIYVPVKTFNY